MLLLPPTISYCLSQLTFTENGMKKLMESCKNYEHVLSEDSVMESFRSIISKGKKFSKPKHKACVEEFEEKLDKYHMEKEQELTVRNTQMHEQKLSSLEELVVGKDPKGQEDSEADAAEAGEVIDDELEGSQEVVDHSYIETTEEVEATIEEDEGDVEAKEEVEGITKAVTKEFERGKATEEFEGDLEEEEKEGIIEETASETSMSTKTDEGSRDEEA